MAAQAVDYPARFDVPRQEEYARLLPLVKWLLAIPHFIALFFVGIGAYFAIIYAFFVVLFTGRWPRGAFDFVLGTTRWGARVNAYLLLMRDEYPPFSLQPEPDYPVTFDIDYPEQGIARWRPLVSWLLVIPFLFVETLVFFVAEICVFIAFFAILFTKQFPDGLFDITRIALRWQTRGLAYLYWMTERYPPFVWA